MAEYKLTLTKREIMGKKLKKLRAEGMIPSVVYGEGEPVMLASEYVATEKVLNGAGYHSPIDLDMAGKAQLAIVKDVAIDPVSRKIMNIEFQAISADAAVEATTPVVIVGFEESEASKIYHFALTQSIEELDVKAKPVDLPGIAEEITKKKEGARTRALAIVGTAIEMLYKSYYITGKEVFLKKLPKFLALYDGLYRNGHVKLHLVADLI